MLTQTAEYALRAMSALAARRGQTIPATELAAIADVPPPYLAKIMQQLAATELVKGQRGIGGGYTLSANPAKTTALDVILAVGPIRQPRNENLLDDLGDGYKSLHQEIDKAAQSVLERFRSVMIGQIVQDVDAIRTEEAQATGVSTGSPMARNEIAS